MSLVGRDAANQIAEKMVRLAGGAFNSETEVYTCLRELADKRIISWAINIPSDPYPERALRTVLKRIGDSEVRRSSLALLNELDAAKESVAAAVGNAESLEAAFDSLEETFTRLTTEAATRQREKILCWKNTLLFAGLTYAYIFLCRLEQPEPHSCASWMNAQQQQPKSPTIGNSSESWRACP